MRPVVGTKLRRALEKRTMEEVGIPAFALMERAALAVADEAEAYCRRAFPGKEKTARILSVSGTGNNGGDGIAAARILKARGYNAAVLAPGREESRSKLNRIQKSIAEKSGVPDAGEEEIGRADVLIDALFGIGLSREITGEMKERIGRMNASAAFKIAVDVPSGIDADTARIMGCCVRADVTVTMQQESPGILFMPGALYSGCIRIADAGIAEPSKGEAAGYVLERQDLEERIPRRDAAGNKGTFGKVLLLAGSSGMCGAAFLAARGAFAAGAGMVRIVTPECNRIPLQTLLPEAIVTAYTDEPSAEAAVSGALEWADAVGAGPGLGTGPCAGILLRAALESGLPAVIDADGLNLLAEDLSLLAGRKAVYLTPHMGEMARLTGRSIASIKENMTACALAFAEKTGAIVHLKDARSVTALPDGRYFTNVYGNSGMACAGSGDVLCGIMAGLAGRGCRPEETAALAHVLHACGGDRAALLKGESAMNARDIADGAGEILKELAR